MRGLSGTSLTLSLFSPGFLIQVFYVVFGALNLAANFFLFLTLCQLVHSSVCGILLLSIVVSSLCQLGVMPPLPTYSSGLVGYVLCGISFGFGSLIFLLLCMALPTFMDSVAVVLIFLLVLSHIASPNFDHDDLPASPHHDPAPTPVPGAIKLRRPRRKTKLNSMSRS